MAGGHFFLVARPVVATASSNLLGRSVGVCIFDVSGNRDLRTTLLDSRRGAGDHVFVPSSIWIKVKGVTRLEINLVRPRNDQVSEATKGKDAGVQERYQRPTEICSMIKFFNVVRFSVESKIARMGIRKPSTTRLAISPDPDFSSSR